MKSLPGLQLPDIEEGPVPCIRVPSSYPNIANWGRIEGCVRLVYDINEHGRTENISVKVSYPEGIFDAATIHALKGWVYYPKQLDGRSVPTPNNVLEMRFELEREAINDSQLNRIVKLIFETFTDFDPQKDPFAPCHSIPNP